MFLSSCKDYSSSNGANQAGHVHHRIQLRRFCMGVNDFKPSFSVYLQTTKLLIEAWQQNLVRSHHASHFECKPKKIALNTCPIVKRSQSPHHA